jgi:hypothetical protein
MAGTKVQIKRSSVAGRVPTASDIDVGQLAVNFTDKRFFTKDGSNTVIDVFGQSLNTTANVSFRDGAFANITATTLVGNLEWSYITSKPDLQINITGDATGSNTFVDLANGSINVTLANTTVTPGTYGNSSAIPVLTIDSKGRVTVATTNTVAGITGFSYASTNNTLSITAGDGSTYKATVNTVNTFAVSNTLLVTGVGTFSNDVIVSGNLIVSGTTTYINTTELNIGDNIISLNADLVGTPSENAGVSVNRGTSANVSLLWDEPSDAWTFTNDGSTYLKIASNTDVDAAYSNAASYADTKAAVAYSNATVYADTKAATAYSNAVSYADIKAAAAYTNAAAYADTKAAAAYSNAVSYTDTSVATTYANATSYADTKAATAYSNAVSHADTAADTAYSNAVLTASADASGKAATAYTNATSYADVVAATSYSNAVSTASTDASSKAAIAYSNAVSTAATDATNKADTAYSNAISYADVVATASYSNATSYADTKAATAYSNAASYADTKAGGAYANAILYAASNTYVNDQLGTKADVSSPSITSPTITLGASIDGNVVLTSTRLSVNGSVGDIGNVLMSGGAGSNAYWSTISLPDLNTTYALSTSANASSANLSLAGSDSTTNNVKFVGAGSVVVASNGSTVTVTGGGGNGFGTVAVVGQSSVVANQSNATLTLVAGSNMTITTNANTGTVTLASSGGGGGGGGSTTTAGGNAFIAGRDNFTANGSQTVFTLSQYATANSILVLVEGLVQFHTEDYDVSGTSLTFSTAPANNEVIEILHLAGASTYHFMQYGAIDSFTGNGSTSAFTLSRSSNTSLATVYIDGLLQSPSTDFTINATTLTFAAAPLSGEAVLVYHNESAVSSIPSTSIASTDVFVGNGTTTNFTLTGTANSSTSMVTINGLVQGYAVDYTVTGTTLTFVDAPPTGSTIQAMRLAGSVGSAFSSIMVGSTTLTAASAASLLNITNGSGVALSTTSNNTINVGLTNIAKQSLAGNGTTTVFTLTYPSTSDNILVHVNGIYFHPDEDYTVSNTTLTFVDAPSAAAEIRIRFMRAPV